MFLNTIPLVSGAGALVLDCSGSTLDSACGFSGAGSLGVGAGAGVLVLAGAACFFGFFV